VRRAALAIVTVLLLVAAGCGVPEDDEPQELSADQVPPGLLTTPTTTSAPAQVLPPERQAELYFVDSEGSVTSIIGEVEDQSAEAIITALLETDPTSLPGGLTSNIPPGTMLLPDISVDDNVLTVDLSPEFTTISGGRFIAAVAQIVFTAGELEGIDAVSFRVEGEHIDVLDEDGASQSDPVTPNDYQTLLA
jgi:spore germination protein GerM